MVRNILNRRNLIACLVLSVVGFVMAEPAKANAANPYLTVSTQVIKQKLSSTQYKAKLKITATLRDGNNNQILVQNTFETAYFVLPKSQNIVLANLDIAGVFKFSGSMKWTGTAITAQFHLEVNWFGTVITKNASASVGAS